ncbi:uncharacterized protein LOC141589714 [Silene latifolia]|uniref:uncharacterized protein LOC141589714 n=1 Tax=Silene latifolia TaxID=37657 RepID=UPI003D76BA03
MLCLWSCWALWEHCNKVIFDAREVDPLSVVWRAMDVMEEIEGGDFTRARRGDGTVRGVARVEEKGWTPPTSKYVKIKVDAGAKEGEGVSVGAVCRDGRGRVLWGSSLVQDQYWDPQVAEAVAVLECISEAARRRHDKIVMESDCLLVVEALRKKAIGRSMLSLILYDILALCNSFTSIVWSFTSRVNNSVAHYLSHLLLRVVGRSVWSDVLPPIPNNAVILDSLLMQ